jgi:hypothetical protein
LQKANPSEGKEKSLKRLRRSKEKNEPIDRDEGYIKCLKSEVKERKKEQKKKAVQARENFCRSSEKRRKKERKKNLLLNTSAHSRLCFGVVQ